MEDLSLVNYPETEKFWYQIKKVLITINIDIKKQTVFDIYGLDIK
jgi:hypothetical protein